MSQYNPYDFTINKCRSEVHIRNRARKGKKTLTTIEGLASDLDLEKIAKAIRKNYKTAASVVAIKRNKKETKKDNDKKDIQYIIQISGDKREQCKEFLTITNIIDSDQDKLIMHGAE